MRLGAGCHPRSSSLTLVEAVAGERVGDGDGEAGGGTEEKTEEEDDVRWEPALSLQAGGNGTYGREGVYDTLQMGPMSRQAYKMASAR